MNGYDIFISYRSSDFAWVEILATNLDKAGYRVFLDEWELAPGYRPVNALHAALKNSRRAILILPADGDESSWVDLELASIIQRTLRDKEFIFIPVQIHNFPVDNLSFVDQYKPVDFRVNDREDYINKFTRLISGLERKPPRSTPTPKIEFTFPPFSNIFPKPESSTQLDKEKTKKSVSKEKPIPPPLHSNIQPWQSPILRLETGMHGAIINRIAVDKQGLFLVTASDDKTARIWRLSDGHLLRTLRPPIGQTPNEGKLYATAISPDGSTVAVAGWTGAEWNESASIYLFDLATGKLRRSLTKLPNVILHLAWSKDGGTLATTLGGKNGVSMYSVADGREVGKDEIYGDRSNWADFDDQGRLVTSSDDYFLRLYDPSWELVAKVKTSGKQPFGVAFSPGGRLVAVGYYDSPQVDILDGSTLNLLYAADTTGVTNNFYGISWSSDGRWLYAGGKHWKDGAYSIRRWADQGKGEFQDFPVSQNVIMDVRPLPDGRVVFGSGDPRWGVMDQKGQIFPQQGPQYADFRDQPLHLSQDGGQVAFSFDFRGERPARFSLATSRLESPFQDDHTLKPPRQQADGLEIKDWEDTFNPTLNGKKLKLEDYERSRSLAITPEGNHFLLGSDWTLRLYNRQGEEQWQNGVPGVAWEVNISGDGRLAVAAFGDGTIRWYRVTDGKELLAFFPHSDGKRWVAWTPTGYYKASADGESLLGWHVNQGLDKEALFYHVSQFSGTFHRPDVVNLVLTTLDEQEAVRLADQATSQ